MHDSRRSRNHARFAFGLAAGVVAAMAAIVAWADLGAWGTVLGTTFFAVGMATIIALVVWGVSAAHQASYFGRLERGEGLVARWTIDPLTWQQVLAERRALDAQPGTVPTLHAFRKAAPAQGFEVVVCETEVFIGPDIWQAFGTGLQARLHGSWIDLDWPHENFGQVMFRVPVAKDAHADAERVVRHFNALLEGRQRA